MYATKRIQHGMSVHDLKKCKKVDWVYHTLKTFSNNLYWFMAFHFFWHIHLWIHQNMSNVICWGIDPDIVINYFFVFLFIKKVDSMLPRICSVIDHRRLQNVVKISVTHWPNRLCVTFLFLPYIWCNLWSITKTDTTTTQTKYIKLIYSFVH